jgi:hypothetical protein
MSIETAYATLVQLSAEKANALEVANSWRSKKTQDEVSNFDRKCAKAEAVLLQKAMSSASWKIREAGTEFLKAHGFRSGGGRR